MRAPPCDGTNSKIAVSKSLNDHRSSPASSHQEVTEVFHVQRAIIDSLYNPKDVKPCKPCETARKSCVPDLHSNSSEDTTNAKPMASRQDLVLPRLT